jgi:hypothetical protein
MQLEKSPQAVANLLLKCLKDLLMFLSRPQWLVSDGAYDHKAQTRLQPLRLAQLAPQFRNLKEASNALQAGRLHR